MTDYRTLLESRAERGTERGAEAVWNGALVPVYIATSPSRSPKSGWPLAAAVAALFLIVVSAAVVIRSDDRQEAATLQAGGPIPSKIPDPMPDGTEVVMVALFPDDLEPLEQRYDDLLELLADTEVLAAEMVDRDSVWEEFEEMFGDRPDVMEAVTPEILPESILLLVPEPSVRDLQARLQYQPGVFQVVLGSERDEGLPLPSDPLDPDDSPSTSISAP